MQIKSAVKILRKTKLVIKLYNSELVLTLIPILLQGNIEIYRNGFLTFFLLLN